MKKMNSVHNRSDKWWMVCFGNTILPVMGRRRVVYGLLLLLTLGALLSGPGRVLAQDPADMQDIQAPLLDETHALRAYRLVETWLADSPEVPTPADPIRVTGLTGVRLTLRSEGIVVGEGEAYRDDILATLDQPGPAVDLVDLLDKATKLAKAGVLDSLADARLRAVLEGRTVPENKQLRVTDVSGQIVVELELGYDLQSLSVSTAADADAVFAQFAPCYHGLGFTDPSQGVWSWVWPGEASARNITPGSQLTLGLKRLGMDRSAVAQLARPDGVGMARFKTIQMVRPSAGADPMRLVRSGTDLPKYAVSDRELTSMSDRLIEHLYHRITTDNEVRGTYLPTSGRYDPPIAPDDQAALVCYAIVHQARYITQARPNDNSPTLYARRVGGVASAITERAMRLGDEADPRVVALMLLTALESPVDEADQATRDRLGSLLMQLVHGGAEADGVGEGLNDGEIALSVAALATLYERTREPVIGESVLALMARLWDQPDQVPNLSALPWLLLAQERAGDLLLQNHQADGFRTELSRRCGVMAGVIDLLCQRQVIEKPALGPDDVLGGYVLTPGPVGSPPNPDWRNAQPLMFLSIALRDDKVTQGRDKLGWLLSAGLSARFVGQLMMDEAACYYVRDRISARGGVRMAPWDNRLALAPAAMSLLALTELQNTVLAFSPVAPAVTETVVTDEAVTDSPVDMTVNPGPQEPNE